MSRRREPLVVGNVSVTAGSRKLIELPMARLFSGTQMQLSVIAIQGRHPGPRVWLSAAIHGDELNGIHIIRDVLRKIDPKTLRGSLLAVPVVNVFGFIQGTRYLPDRRDLNRSFPGSERGSLASRVAHLFVQEIIARCDIGIDLHTAGLNRTNLPHLRADLEDDETRRLAEAFGGPLIYPGSFIQGTLRATAQKMGKRVLLYEAGEPNRFDQPAIRIGIAGVMRVLAALDMIDVRDDAPCESQPPAIGLSSRWVRARRSGVFYPQVQLGDRVEEKQPLGSLSDPHPGRETMVKSPFHGLIVGSVVNPLVHQGDGLMHVVKTA